ncbi:MAG: four-carbon acid sugar kinase family protein [Cellulomonadaceae bacterium]|jgi:uncharacterized protein YgbK (DUF1537 family)|nr:four-carbon acid sugar kinase family protein [Cellulomonadaceae bacterium]
MADILVVADDMTGANATAAGLARTGRRAVTVAKNNSSEGQQWEAIAESHTRFDAIVASTDSRHASPEDAAQAVTRAVRAGWPVKMLSCRIDSTLRGNVGASAQAVITAARDLSGRRVVGLCLSAHPEAGRFAVEGNQLLGGVRLEDTELARDVRSPITTSSIDEVLRRDSNLTCAHIPLSTVTGGESQLQDAVRAAVDAGVDIIIGDSLSVDHLVRLARAAAAITAEQPDLYWVGIDPGPGSVALADALLGLAGSASHPPMFAVSGSATQLTRTQLQRLISERDVVVVKAGTRDDASASVLDLDAIETRLDEAFDQVHPGGIVLLATVLDESDLRPLTHEQSTALPNELGRLTRRILESHPVGGIYTTGGDITTAVVAALGGQGIAITDEVVPLATAGEIVGGPYDGTPIATKGGLAGQADAAIACLDHLAHAASVRARWVSAASPR